MTGSATESPHAERVEFKDDALVVHLSDGRALSAPLGGYPRLHSASPEQRANWRLIAGGTGIHWEDVDEDISVRGLLSAADGTAPKARVTRADELRFASESKTALSAQDWHALLALLMQFPSLPSHSKNAYMRARCHLGLGDPQQAVLFIEDAARLEPENLNFRVLAIALLTRVSEFDEALRLAAPAIADPRNAHPKLVIAGAHAILDRAAESMTPDVVQPELERVCRLLEVALPRHNSLPSAQRTKSVAVAGYVDLAISRATLGRVHEARAALERAFEMDPANPHLPELRNRLESRPDDIRGMREASTQIQPQFAEMETEVDPIV